MTRAIVTTIADILAVALVTMGVGLFSVACGLIAAGIGIGILSYAAARGTTES